MGVFDIPKGKDDIIDIRNPEWDEGEQCRARKTVLVKDREWVENQQLQIKRARGNRQQRRHGGFQQADDIDIQAAFGEVDRLWVFRMLVDWTFTKDGMPMPLTLEAVRELPQDVLNYIYDEIMDAQPKPKEPPKAKQGGKESENPTLIGASGSIVGVSSKEDREPSDESGSRNYLTKS